MSRTLATRPRLLLLDEVLTGLNPYFFETGHKLFFGLLLAVVIVWDPKGLFGKSIRKEQDFAPQRR